MTELVSPLKMRLRKRLRQRLRGRLTGDDPCGHYAMMEWYVGSTTDEVFERVQKYAKFVQLLTEAHKNGRDSEHHLAQFHRVHYKFMALALNLKHRVDNNIEGKMF